MLLIHNFHLFKSLSLSLSLSLASFLSISYSSSSSISTTRNQKENPNPSSSPSYTSFSTTEVNSSTTLFSSLSLSTTKPISLFFVCLSVMDDFKRNQIPAFGNWDYSDGLPITQYFESARQAGLLRYSCGERDLYGVEDDLIYPNHLDLIKPSSITVVSRRKTKGGVRKEKRYNNNNNKVCNIKEQKKQGRVYDLTEPSKHQHSLSHHHFSSGPNPHEEDEEEDQEEMGVFQHQIPPTQRPPKAIDEDLYKIPPELLYKQPKRKKMFGLFSCLVPNCAA